MRGRTALVLWVTIGVLLAGDIVALRAVDKISYPSRWDPRVAALAEFVEGERKLKFDHPVHVDFLPVEEYRELITGGDESELSDEEKEEIELFEGQARALGLIGTDSSIVDDLETIAESGTLAFYSHDEKKMVIRGTELTVQTRVTLVHELTHALQDQAFDIGRDFESAGQTSFFDGLVEGDAERVEDAYIETLDEAERAAYEAESDASSEEASDELDTVAPAISNLFAAPYALGGLMTTLVVDEEGLEKLNALFRNPPASDEGLLDVFAAINSEGPKEVAPPKLPAGAKKIEDDEGDFGALTWFVVLGSFVDAKTALLAADGWGGDAYVGYTKGGKSCISIAFVGDTSVDSQEMLAALNQWKSAFTENTVQVTADGDRVQLDACEPKAVPTPRADSGDSLSLPAVRIVILSGILGEGAPSPFAECVANQIIVTVPIDQITSESEAVQQALQPTVQRIALNCRAATVQA